MKIDNVTMVRIYLTEAEHKLRPLVRRLHDQEKVRGVSVFRAIEGFGTSGEVHTSSLLDLSLNPPLVIEFFDKTERVPQVLEHLLDLVDPDHIVSWPAQTG